MRKFLLACVVTSLAIGLLALPVSADKGGKKASDCIRIKDGVLVDSKGHLIELGFDEWGYNYQAHMFYGFYNNYLRPDPPATDDDTMLMMKWNDAWLSNMDCDEDGLLDRYYGFDSYIGSGAWLTNHMWGSYVGDDGKTYSWTYFCKIVAAPADAYTSGGFWYTADGVEIGPVIWGAFAIVQEVSNDPGVGDHGLLYRSPAGPGFGKYKP
jgi:hypothetical protein